MSSEASGLAKKVEKVQDKMAPDQVIVAQRDDAAKKAAPRSANTMDEQFPTEGLVTHTERDKVMGAKLALSDGTGITPFGQLKATDADFKWLQEKQKAAEAANFQAWFAREFDHMSPADKKRAKELYPEFYAQRKKLLKKQTKNLYDLTRIKLEGIQSREDLIKVYLAETGRLDLGPLQTIMHPEDSLDGRARAAANFKRGIYSPFRVFGDQGYDYRAEGAANMEQSRNLRAKMFRAGVTGGFQDGPAVDTKYGLTTGFPPMGNADFKQGDKQWYDMLNQ